MPVLVFGVFLGSAGWWLALSGRGEHDPPYDRSRPWSRNWNAGGILVVFGIYTLAHLVMGLPRPAGPAEVPRADADLFGDPGALSGSPVFTGGALPGFFVEKQRVSDHVTRYQPSPISNPRPDPGAGIRAPAWSRNRTGSRPGSSN